jgi:hypothetical protein
MIVRVWSRTALAIAHAAALRVRENGSAVALRGGEAASNGDDRLMKPRPS